MYNRYAEDFYGEFYDQTTDDTDYAHREGESSDERHSRNYVSRTHDIELLNAKFNPRPSRPAGNAKVRSQTIEKVYRSKKGRKGGFVKKLNNAVRLHTVDDESSMDYMYRDQTTRLGGTLDFTQRTSHRQALDSLTYNFTQERGLDSLTMGTIMLTEGSEPGDLGIYDRLRPLINSDMVGHSISYIQAENEELKEHVKRLSYKLLKMEKNCGFASESMFSQNLGSTVVYHTRPHILQEEMDVVDQEYQAVMSEYNYLANRLKQLRDPMYRKELEDKRLKVVEETNMIAKMLKNTMKRADIEEKELQAIKEGKKYPEILREVNLKQTEMMKIQKKLEVLRKKNREFERERNIKEEREKELNERFEGLQYMDDYYRGASLDRTQRKTRRSEEEVVKEKRAGSVNRGDSTGYAKQIEDAKNKYMRQQLLSEIESLTLQNMQEKEHLSKLEEIAREQRQMIYNVMEREKITGFEWSKNIKEVKEPQKQPKISKEFLTPPKADVAEKKTFDLQVLKEEEIDDREDEYSDDWAMKSQSSDSNGKAAKSSIRIRKVNVPSPKKEKEKTAVKKDEVHDEVVIVKEDKESKAVVKMSPRLKEKAPVEIVSKKVETVEKGTSPVNSQKSKESPQKGRVLEESSLSIQCLSDLQEEKEYSMKSQKESPRSEENKQDNKEKVEPVELKLIEKEGAQHEIAQVVSLGESMAMVEEAIQPKEKVVIKEEIVKKVVVPVVEVIAVKEEVIQPKAEVVNENTPVVEQDIKEEVLEEQVSVPPVLEEKIFETIEVKAESVEVTAEIVPETVKVLKPVLSRRSTNRQLRMPSIPELLKENSTEKDPTPQKSEPIEAVNQFETKEDTPKSDIPVISEASVHEEEPEKVMETQTEQEDLEEDKPKEDEKVMETQTEQECLEEGKPEEPKELVLPECVLKTRKSLFKKNDEVQEEEVQKEKEQAEVQAEEKVEVEVEGSSTTKPAGKPVVKFGQVGLMGRMNTIRRPNITEATPKNGDKKKEEVKPVAKVATKQFVMPARKLVISKGVGTTKRNMAVGKQEGIVAVKGTSEARSEPFTEMSSSEYFVSEAGSGLLPESIVVMRTEKVSIAVGTDDVYAGTGKLVENLMLGKEKDVRELALDFERKLREKTMTMTMQKEVKKEVVMVEKGTEAMLYGC